MNAEYRKDFNYMPTGKLFILSKFIRVNMFFYVFL